MATGRRYMQGNEFIERQSAFAFFCARTVAYLAKFKAECLKGWKTLFSKAASPQEQLQLNFYDWWAIWTPERNRELF